MNHTSAKVRKEGFLQMLRTAGEKGLSSRQLAGRQGANIRVTARLLGELRDEGIVEMTGEKIGRSAIWRMT